MCSVVCIRLYMKMCCNELSFLAYVFVCMSERALSAARVHVCVDRVCVECFCCVVYRRCIFLLCVSLYIFFLCFVCQVYGLFVSMCIMSVCATRARTVCARVCFSCH